MQCSGFKGPISHGEKPVPGASVARYAQPSQGSVQSSVSLHLQGQHFFFLFLPTLKAKLLSFSFEGNYQILIKSHDFTHCVFIILITILITMTMPVCQVCLSLALEQAGTVESPAAESRRACSGPAVPEV